MTTTTTPAPRAGRREWIALAVLCCRCSWSRWTSRCSTSRSRSSARTCDPSATEQLWIFDIYGFVLAGLLITMGALGDRIGRRRLLLIGAAAFGAASRRSRRTPTAPRCSSPPARVLGIGGATLMPSTLALIRNMFHDAKQRGTGDRHLDRRP